MKKVALITGASKRIGRAMAEHLATMGYSIALHCNSSIKEALATQKTLKKKKVPCEIFQADLTVETKAASLINQVKAKFKRIDVLINNASTFTPSALKTISNEQLNQNINIHLKVPVILSKEFARVTKKGNIINILDTNISKNKTKYFSYLLSKKALESLTKLSAVELAPHIRVNAIAPGIIIPPEGKKNDHATRLAKTIPLQKKGKIENITQSLEFLLTNDFLVGETIFVDGGEHLL